VRSQLLRLNVREGVGHENNSLLDYLFFSLSCRRDFAEGSSGQETFELKQTRHRHIKRERASMVDALSTYMTTGELRRAQTADLRVTVRKLVAPHSGHSSQPVLRTYGGHEDNL